MPQHFAVVCMVDRISAAAMLHCDNDLQLQFYSGYTRYFTNQKKNHFWIFSFEVATFLCLNLIKFMMRLTFLLLFLRLSLSFLHSFSAYMIARLLLKPFYIGNFSISNFELRRSCSPARLPALIRWCEAD